MKPEKNFVAIDVEYADSEQNICQFGIAIVKNLEITLSRSWLIQPPGNCYEERCSRVHHITPEMTATAGTFEVVWQEIQPYLITNQLWAHNAVSVEQPVIEKNLDSCNYGHDWISICDSRDLYQRPDCPPNTGNGLAQCCMAIGIPCENHHDAEADAVMCAKLVIAAAKGQQPDWSGVPVSNEMMRKEQQEKRVLRLGVFTTYFAEHTSGEEDVFAVLSSTDGSGIEQVVDVFDKGDQSKECVTAEIDFDRVAVNHEYPVRGKSVTLTGMFNCERREIKLALEMMGIHPTSSISGKTAAIIAGTRNVGPRKLIDIESQEQRGHHIPRIVGDNDLLAFLYGDGMKFFTNE